MTEYAMAKAAGELLCADINRWMRGVRVITTRLPRLLTDQTATSMPTTFGNAVDVMLLIIREMQGVSA
jgi:nucleoside-diphosphate-sugar epimerase